MAHLQLSQLLPTSRLEAFDFLTCPDNLPNLLLPLIDVQVLTPDIPLKRGNEVHFMMTRFGLSQSVRFRVEDVLRGSRLTYRQSEGIFASWTHTMKFEDYGNGQVQVIDIVDYEVPFGLLGFLADDLLLKRDMRKILSERLKRALDHFNLIAASTTEQAHQELND